MDRTVLYRRIGIAALAVVGTLGLAYAADVALAGDKLPRGTRIGGVDVGGKSRSAAAVLLERAVAERARRPVVLHADGTPGSVDPVRAGLRLDVRATLDRAGGSALNPWTRFRTFFASTESPLVPALDPAKLRAEVTRLATALDRPVREGAVRFAGTEPQPVLPQTGRRVDVEASAVAIARSYLRSDRPVPMNVAVTPVKSTVDGVRRAVAEIATPAVAGPVQLDAGGRRVTMTAATIARTLVIEADQTGTLVHRFDPKQLDAVLHPALDMVELAPKDADFNLVDGKVAITPSQLGRQVDLAALARDLRPAVQLPVPRTVPLRIVDAEPKLSTARAQTLGIKEVIGEFTTYHPCCRPRVHNIHLMADIVDGAVVLPGETFSLNGHVGARDAKRGFVKAPMILNGRFVQAVGGGVSQFATTMFNAVFFSGLQDVAHKPHSYYISRYPAGREATVSSPEPDLKWRNDSPYGVLVKTSYTGKSITVTFWSTKRYDVESVSGPRTRVKGFGVRYDPRPDCESASGAPGFDIVVWRVFKLNGAEVRRQRFFTRYLPEPRFVCGRPPAPAPKPSPSPSPSG